MPPKSETVSVVLRLSDALHANRCINTETHCTQDMEEASNPPSGDRKCNDFPRCLFFSPNGRLFCLTDAGNYFTVSTEEYSNSIPFQTVVQPLFRYGDVKLLDDVVCSAQTLPYPAPSNLSIDSTQSASCVGVFRGYTVSAANRSLPVVAIGDRYGKVALFLISEELPYLICTDLLKVKGKVMQLLWIGRSLLLIATQSDRAHLISVEWDLRYPCLFRGTVQRFCFHLGSKDTWATSAHHLPLSNRSPAVTNHAIFVLGLRDGSLFSYALPPKSSLLDGLDSTPAWSLCTCHGPGGCCSITSVPRSSPPVILSCGRTYGEIRQWLVETDGRLTMLSQLSNPGGLTWVERFHLTLDGRLFALGFQSVHFKVYPLHSATTADGCIPRFSLDCLNGPPMFRAACGGAHRHWEFWLPDSSSGAQLSCSKVSPGTESVAWSDPTPGPVLAFVKRCDVVVQLQPPSSNVCSTLKGSLQLRPGLHGRDLNCCLVFSYPCTSPVDRSSDAIVRSGTLLYCLAGGEDTCLSSWALQVNSAAQEKAYFISPIHLFPVHVGGSFTQLHAFEYQTFV
ncbi:unnamed protein product [Dicrocoelium dendriticum]|nr:unnamed protein product [Dicrocoelium dendriticum]